MKNGSKNKFLLPCFRPEVVDIETVLESRDSVNRTSSSRRFSCISVTPKHDAEFLDQGRNWVPPQHPPKRKLAKVVKAVVFETILNRRAQYKNNGFSQDCFGSKRSNSGSSSAGGEDEKSKLRLKSKETNYNIKGRELSLPCSSSSNPVSESKKELSKSKYECNRGELQSEKQKKMLKCVGVILALISLAFTVACGKWKGIFWTSIWLCCFSLLLATFRRLKLKGFANSWWNSESSRIWNHIGSRNH